MVEKKVWKLVGRRDERWSEGGAAAVTARIAFVMDCQDDGKGKKEGVAAAARIQGLEGKRKKKKGSG